MVQAFPPAIPTTGVKEDTSVTELAPRQMQKEEWRVIEAPPSSASPDIFEEPLSSKDVKASANAKQARLGK